MMFRQFPPSRIHMDVLVSVIPSENCLNPLNQSTKGIDASKMRKYGLMKGNSSSGCPNRPRLKYRTVNARHTKTATTVFAAKLFFST